MKSFLSAHLSFRRLMPLMVLTCLGLTSLQAQNPYLQPEWKFGLNAGLNFNFSAPGYQDLSPGTPAFVPLVVNDGTGVGPYVGLMAEYNSDALWGVQLRVSYDDRSATVDDPTTDPAGEYDVNYTYLSIEPLFRFYPEITPGLHFTAGPLLGINLSGEYDYNPPEGSAQPAIAGAEIPELSSLVLGLSAGVGYDILLSERADDTWLYLSPFADVSWVVNQRASSFPTLDQNSIDDIWSTVSVRAGVKFLFGDRPADLVEVTGDNPLLNFSLAKPTGGLVRYRELEEYFPIVPNVFFDSASTQIPGRYTLLDKGEADEFDEADLLDKDDIGNLTAAERANSQLNTYYNVLNIIGTRMRNNPAEKITLVGSGNYTDDGAEMAASVKRYLTDVFGIDGGRISVRSQQRPTNPSGSAGTPQEDRHLAERENRRVEILSSGGSDDILKPVKIAREMREPIDNDLVLDLGEEVQVDTWRVNVTGENRNLSYGPFRRASQRINPASLISNLDEGSYTAEVIVNTKDGEVIRSRKDFELVVRTDSVQKGTRYSIVFPYGKKDAVKLYENFLRESVATAIEPDDKVLVYGFTDVIGNSDLNYRLSVQRAAEVRDILKDQADKDGVNVPYEAIGFGEGEARTLFPNTLPEGRFYNRTVVIEMVPNS